MSSRARSSKASGDLVEHNVVQRVRQLRSIPDVTAEWVDAGGDRPSDQDYHQLRWTSVIQPSQVGVTGE